ncbi:alpha/beta hydrolase [Luteimonas suaedae]|uniref:alpha/beta hydrolase n=1 Tax=Luteimonas suaedae TaxID=2605430 RepID=UPI001658EE85|nr:alpha/beta hydrolase-fold protein [Luteimonas suaedae]
MLRLVLVAVLLSACTPPPKAGPPQAVAVSTPDVSGRLLRHTAFPSRHVAARNVDVWLPPGYARDPQRRYPVLYMHDDQNLFDPATAYGGIDWGIDETMTRLIADGAVREAIVVGIWNTPQRFGEYMPEKAVTTDAVATGVDGFDPLPRTQVVSDAYLRFLVDELKPTIDAAYRTLPARDDTLVMGSSMGGLIALYAIAEYPQVFGAAAAVSTHWPAADGAMIDWLAPRLPDPATHRLYFDHGTATLDAGYAPYQRRMDAIVRAAGYVNGENWISLRFEGAEHAESAWRKRVHRPLIFLLGPAGRP